MAREKEFPGIGSNACFNYARLVVEEAMVELYTDALQAVEEYGSPVFPVHAYYQSGMRAAVAQNAGEHDAAKAHAEKALASASVSDTGLSHGRGHLGTVRNQESDFHKAIMRIVSS
ncbi:MAG: hypothetical protein H8E53_08015 [Planctomycetes bacterium]|nr:hypothetical protein [Planctomycetota bacterium]